MALAPFEREQRLSKHRRWCAGICGNSLLQAAEAGLQLVGTSWAGHSVEVLLRIYAKCVDGGDALIRQRVQAALGYDDTATDVSLSHVRP